jgi:hypothetical protein
MRRRLCAKVLSTALMLWAFGAACRPEAAAPAPLPPLAASLFEVQRALGGGESAPGASALRALAATARQALARVPGRPASVALGEAIFQTAGFVREVDDSDLRYVFLSSVLEAHRGSCVGLGTLFLAVAELADVRARGVMAPGHFYVQVQEGDGGRWRNVELLRRGEEMPDEWYRARYGAVGRPLGTGEIAGVVAYDVGNERRRQGRAAEARRAYELATGALPAFAEAHASLGATLQLLGALDAAAAAYARARALEPGLVGLDRNVGLLEAERASRRARD